jgi:ferredoxin
MAYMISSECINCSACEYECPVRAISPGPAQFAIDPSTCVECDGYFDVPRCKSVCPVAACSPAREGYLAKMRALSARGAPPVVLRPAAEGGR